MNQSDTPIEGAISAFAEFGADAAYFVPTGTGLRKGIVDAHAAIRAQFRTKRIHDYAEQAQGPSAKKVLDVELLFSDHTEIRQMSLYRPETKSGDPRFWISRLGNYASPGNLLAILIAEDGRLALVNCSDTALMGTRHRDASPLRTWLDSLRDNAVSDELLGELRLIAAKGFVPSLRQGDTGVGYTLETLLGISANSSRGPDYRGIELKASRLSPSNRGGARQSLFSQVPDWRRSRVQSAAALLEQFADVDEASGLRRFYCTVTSTPNPRGLFFTADIDSGDVEHRVLSPQAGGAPVVLWSAETLLDALALKHRETFWVSAAVRRDEEDREHFHFLRVVHTKAPLIGNFLPLIIAGKISMDYTIRERSPGSLKDHGYLFKILRSHHHQLFPSPRAIDLTLQGTS